MTSEEAPHPDAIPAEMFKTGDETIWNQEHLPQEFRTPLSSTSTSLKETVSPETTSEEYPSCL